MLAPGGAPVQLTNVGLEGIKRRPGQPPPGFVPPPFDDSLTFEGHQLRWSSPDGPHEVRWRSALLAVPALAQTYAFPSDPTDWPEFYPTAYVDHGGVLDWDCGALTYGGHHGNDFGGGGFAGMDAGRTITAAAEGTVIYTHDGEFDRCTTGDCYGGGGFGNWVQIEHADGKSTIYGHMKQWSVAVATGDPVVCGQVLGEMGSSGYSTGPHLHFEVRNASGTYEDPFDGPCNLPRTYWTSQGAYAAVPDLTCADPPECVPAAALACGDAVSGTNADPGSTTATWAYGCDDWTYSGPELSWTFSTALDEPVTLAVSGLTGDLDVHVLDSTACDGTGCVASSSNPDTDDEGLTFDAVAGQEYVVVLDGYEGTVSPFELRVTCVGSAASTGDTGPIDDTDPPPPTGGTTPTDPGPVSDPGVVETARDRLRLPLRGARRAAGVAPVPLAAEASRVITWQEWRDLLADRPLPAAVVDLDALDRNVDRIVAALGASPATIRLASKSVRHAGLMRRILARGNGRIRGILAYAAREVELLAAEGFTDLLLAYPVAPRRRRSAGRARRTRHPLRGGGRRSAPRGPPRRGGPRARHRAAAVHRRGRVLAPRGRRPPRGPPQPDPRRRGRGPARRHHRRDRRRRARGGDGLRGPDRRRARREPGLPPPRSDARAHEVGLPAGRDRTEEGGRRRAPRGRLRAVDRQRRGHRVDRVHRRGPRGDRGRRRVGVPLLRTCSTATPGSRSSRPRSSRSRWCGGPIPAS